MHTAALEMTEKLGARQGWTPIRLGTQPWPYLLIGQEEEAAITVTEHTGPVKGWRGPGSGFPLSSPMASVPVTMASTRKWAHCFSMPAKQKPQGNYLQVIWAESVHLQPTPCGCFTLRPKREAIPRYIRRIGQTAGLDTQMLQNKKLVQTIGFQAFLGNAYLIFCFKKNPSHRDR